MACSSSGNWGRSHSFKYPKAGALVFRAGGSEYLKLWLRPLGDYVYVFTSPTSFVLKPEAVDRLRSAAGTIIASSPEFKRLLSDVGVRMIETPAPVTPPTQ